MIRHSIHSITPEDFARAVEATKNDLDNLFSDTTAAMTLPELETEGIRTLGVMVRIQDRINVRLEQGKKPAALLNLYEGKRDYLRRIGETMSLLICGDFYPKKRRVFAKNPILERIFSASRRELPGLLASASVQRI